MMAKPNTPSVRVDPLFEIDLRDLAKVRLDKGLAKFTPRALSMAEMTRLLRRTQGYKLSLNELKVKPKKENLL